jgi:hypothetical protein
MKKCAFVLSCIFGADETKVSRVAVNNKALSVAGKMHQKGGTAICSPPCYKLNKFRLCVSKISFTTARYWDDCTAQSVQCQVTCWTSENTQVDSCRSSSCTVLLLSVHAGCRPGQWTPHTLSPRQKAAEAWDKPLSSTQVEVNNERKCISTPPTCHERGCRDYYFIVL